MTSPARKLALRLSAIDAALDNVQKHPRPGVFALLTDKEASALLSFLLIREHRRGQRVVVAGEHLSKFFIVISGSLEITRTSRTQKTVVLNRVGSGDVVGEVSALARTGATADVTCLGPCVIGEMSGESFKSQLSELPHFGRFVMESLARRLATSTEKLVQIATEDVPSRVLHALQGMSAPRKGVNQGAYAICERPTQAELARMVGTSREVVARSLRLLEASGEIEQEGRSIFLKMA